MNLSEPAAVIYPVTGPGYYCAAAVLSSGDSFVATVRAIEPRAPVRAFRAGLLALYRGVGPLWAGLVALWLVWRTAFLPRPPGRGPLGLALLSAAQVTARWAGLALGDEQGARISWRLLWYLLRSSQAVAALLLTQKAVVPVRKGPRSLAYDATLTLSVLAIETATDWADVLAEPFSREPLYVNIFAGLASALYLAFCSFRLLRQPETSWTSKPWLPPSFPRRLLATALGAVCVLFLLVAVVNVWAASQQLTPLEFASHFWRIRSTTLDASRDLIALAWVFSIVLFWECVGEDDEERGREKHMVDARGV